jgi:hypothetical protein
MGASQSQSPDDGLCRGDLRTTALDVGVSKRLGIQAHLRVLPACRGPPMFDVPSRPPPCDERAACSPTRQQPEHRHGLSANALRVVQMDFDNAAIGMISPMP